MLGKACACIYRALASLAKRKRQEQEEDDASSIDPEFVRSRKRARVGRDANPSDDDNALEAMDVDVHGVAVEETHEPAPVAAAIADQAALEAPVMTTNAAFEGETPSEGSIRVTTPMRSLGRMSNLSEFALEVANSGGQKPLGEHSEQDAGAESDINTPTEEIVGQGKGDSVTRTSGPASLDRVEKDKVQEGDRNSTEQDNELPVLDTGSPADSEKENSVEELELRDLSAAPEREGDGVSPWRKALASGLLNIESAAFAFGVGSKDRNDDQQLEMDHGEQDNRDSLEIKELSSEGQLGEADSTGGTGSQVQNQNHDGAQDHCEDLLPELLKESTDPVECVGPNGSPQSPPAKGKRSSSLSGNHLEPVPQIQDGFFSTKETSGVWRMQPLNPGPPQVPQDTPAPAPVRHKLARNSVEDSYSACLKKTQETLDICSAKYKAAAGRLANRACMPITEHREKQKPCSQSATPCTGSLMHEAQPPPRPLELEALYPRPAFQSAPMSFYPSPDAEPDISSVPEPDSPSGGLEPLEGEIMDKSDDCGVEKNEGRDGNEEEMNVVDEGRQSQDVLQPSHGDSVPLGGEVAGDDVSTQEEREPEEPGNGRKISEADLAKYREILAMPTSLQANKLEGFDFNVSELQCLAEKQLLNGEVMNGYMKMLQQRDGRWRDTKSGSSKVHFCQTLLVAKLTKGSYKFKSVRNLTQMIWLREWGQKCSTIIDCKTVIFPVQLGSRWILIEADLKQQCFTYYDPHQEYNPGVIRAIGQYLMDEAQDKTGKELNMYEWEVAVPGDVPQVLNDQDSAVFALQCARCIAAGQPLDFTPEDMSSLRVEMMMQFLAQKVE